MASDCITDNDLARQFQQLMVNGFMVEESDGFNQKYEVQIRFSTLKEMQDCHTLLIALSDPSSRPSLMRQGLLATPPPSAPRVPEGEQKQ